MDYKISELFLEKIINSVDMSFVEIQEELIFSDSDCKQFYKLRVNYTGEYNPGKSIEKNPTKSDFDIIIDSVGELRCGKHKMVLHAIDGAGQCTKKEKVFIFRLDGVEEPTEETEPKIETEKLQAHDYFVQYAIDEGIQEIVNQESGLEIPDTIPAKKKIKRGK